MTKFVRQHRDRALSPDRPMLRGTAQNPDVFFQAREAINPFYRACPTIVQDVMDRFARRTGRAYHLFDYVGDPGAERVIILMGSGAGAAEETIERLIARGEKVGLLKVRLFRPFDERRFRGGIAENDARDRGAGSHQGARRRRRAALSRCRDGAQRGVGGGHRSTAGGRASSADATACHQRNSHPRW